MMQKWYKFTKFPDINTREHVLSIVIILLSFAVYFNSLKGDFIWDDIEQIVENPVIKNILNIPSFFTSDLWKLIGNPTIASHYYRPFFLFSLAIDYQLWGLNPLGYHITNLILHGIASFLVYQIGRNLFKHNIPAFISAIFFVVHPVHVESVTWISGRTDPMAAVFFLLSFYLYILFVEKNRITFLMLSLIAYIFSLLSKEMSITLPLLLLAYEISYKHTPSPYSSPHRGEGWVRGLFLGRIKSLQIIGVYLFISLAYLYIRTTILGEITGGDSSSAPIDKRLWTSFGILLNYLRIMILPVNLKILYDIPLKESLLDWQVISSIVVLTVIFILNIWTYHINKTIFFASLWFFITILPVTNIVPLKPTMMAERYLYIPSISICFLGGFAFYSAYQRDISWLVYLKSLIIIILLFFSVITFYRNSLWKNEVVYFTRMTEDAPQNAYAHHNLGDAYRRRGEMKSAIIEWGKAVDIYPLHPEANNSLANIALMQGDYPEAVRKYTVAIQGKRENAEAHYNIAIALEKLGRFNEAASHYKEFITMASAQYQSIIEEIKIKIKFLEEAH